MVSFEEAGTMLDEALDALPQEITDGLNGGVNLIPASRTDEHGLLVMGMYFNDQMGRHIEIYYGSFSQAFSDAPPEKCRRELTKVLKHELTHHIEGLAGDRSLEKWDEQHVRELLDGLGGGPLRAKSILFVCDDDAGLAPIAEGLFRLAAEKACPDIKSASAGTDEPPERVNPRAVKAAALYNANISGHTPRAATRALVGEYDAVLCMTEEQGDELAGRWPEYDGRIMCLGERDIQPPGLGLQPGWNRSADTLAVEIEYLVDELTGEDADDDYT